MSDSHIRTAWAWEWPGDLKCTQLPACWMEAFVAVPQKMGGDKLARERLSERHGCAEAVLHRRTAHGQRETAHRRSGCTPNTASTALV